MGHLCYIFYLDFSEAFDIVSLKILIVKLMRYRLDEHRMRWLEKNWPRG